MCCIRTLYWVWKSKASFSAFYFEIQVMRVTMRFKYKTYNIYESAKIIERSMSYFRVVLFNLGFKMSPGAEPFIRKWVWIARQWTFKEHLFQYQKLWIKSCFKTEVLKSNSKMTSWFKINFFSFLEERFDTVGLDLSCEVRGKDLLERSCSVIQTSLLLRILGFHMT